MNTILPKFVDFNNKTAFTDISNWQPTPDLIYMNICKVLVAVVIIIFVISIAIRVAPSFGNKSHIVNDNINNYLLFTEIVLILFIVIMHAFSIMAKGNNLSIEDDYNEGGFKIAQTNLMAAPYKISATANDTFDNKAIKPNKNYHSSDYYVYVDLINTKPTGIDSDYVINQTPVDAPMVQIIHNGSYAENDNSKSTIFLGHMKNGTFIPNYKNKKVAHTFVNYLKYIKKHQLESKFKHHFSFQVSDVYFTEEHAPVLVVVGDNKFTLHYKNNKPVKDADIVQSK